MSVFLIGYMGSGKSTIGNGLSVIMNIPFFDLDSVIEKKIGMTIHNIFREKGEHFFREQEHSILTNLNLDNKSIIAAGGGTPCFFDNHNFMKKMGSTVYLKVTPNELCNRLQLDDKRPLLFNNKLNLKDFVHEQLFERDKYYQMSDYTIESDNISINQVHELVNKII
jgi:shikimate kinase